MRGKRVFISGAAGGIGLALVRQFKCEGAQIVATDLQGERAVRAIASDAIFHTHDISDPAAWDRILEDVTTRIGGLDVMINNAAYLADAPLLDVSIESMRRHIDINLIGTWLGMKAGANAMIAGGQGGSIVNLASVSGMMGHPNRGAYAATKWAIRGLTRTAALEWADHGIRVNAVVPGPIDTPMSRQARGYAPEHSLSEIVLPEIPLKRFGRAEEVAQAVFYLASDASTYVTGTELVIDGGCLLSR